MHAEVKMLAAALLAAGLMAKGEPNDKAVQDGLALADRMAALVEQKPEPADPVPAEA